MEDISKQIEALEAKIQRTEPGLRYTHQEKLHNLIEEMVAAGQKVPARLRLLDEELTNDAIEAQFDNMPV